MEVYKGGVSDQVMTRALAQLCPLEEDWAEAHMDKLGFTTS
jgi:hypothetical protein